MGAIIGIERERRAKGNVFAGFRTFMLVCSLGYISAYIYSQFSQVFALISFLILGMLCSLNFYRKILRKKEKGVTTEIALLITFFIGFVLFFEESPYIFSLTLTFVVTMVLLFKETLHEFAHRILPEEIRDFLIFGLVGFVIYPILPSSPLDPWGIINLKFIWWALVIILGLSFLIYTIFKIVKYKGILINAIFGGMINSIYMTNFFSSFLKEQRVAKYAILASVSSMILRVFILSVIINPRGLVALIFLPVTAMIGYLLSFVSIRKIKRKIAIAMKSPLDLKFALLYILLFVFIFFVAEFLYLNFGKRYTYLILPIGIVDTSSLTVTVSSILENKDLSNFLLTLVVMNLIGNFLFAYRNNKQIGREVAKVFSFIMFLLLVFYYFFSYFI